MSEEEAYPDQAVDAVRELLDSSDRSVVGVGNWIASYEDPTTTDGESVIVSRITGLDHCGSSGKSCLHGDVILEADVKTAEAAFTYRTPALAD